MLERLEGLHSIDGLKNMLAHAEYVIRDIQKEEPFEVADIIKFLTFKMEVMAVKKEL
jgi:hypothetical protein